MLDFSDGTTWFLCGLGVTLFFTALLVVFTVFAPRVGPR